MNSDSIVFSIFLIFSGAALLSTLVLYTRQSLLVAYILLGMILGPYGFKFIANAHLIQETGDIGIVFLLFLLGLHLDPKELLHMLRKATLVTLVSSVLFALVSYVIARLFHLSNIESWIIAGSMMFSSTIVGLKLLPTSVLHHQHIGEIMISILLLQDILAIVVLLLLHGTGVDGIHLSDISMVFIVLPVLLVFAFTFERYVLVKLLNRFDRVQEYIFLLAIGWCLGMSELAGLVGLSKEIGAFIAGVSIATGPIALYIAESLKPLRDFFLVMFFFAVGASFDWHILQQAMVPVLVLATSLLLLKPWLFSFLLRRTGETKAVAWEVGVRLGQASEFSLLVAYLAMEMTPPLLTAQASAIVQAATILTFIVSSYWVVLRYPTPMALSDKMRRD